MPSESDFQADNLIEAVKKRPRLYDKSVQLDPVEKNCLWKQVAAEFYTDWDSFDKGVAYEKVLYLMKKWRSLRDAYHRELRTRRRVGVSRGRKIYVHYHKLKFLGDDDDTVQAEEDEEEDDTNHEDDSASEPTESEVKVPEADGDFNADLLIKAVKKRPQIYNKHMQRDPIERSALWKEVGAEYYKDWNTYNKATIYEKVLYLMKKWKSLRDAYNREVRRRGNKPRKNRVYVHYHKMKFLEGLDDGDETKDADEDGIDDSNFEDNLATEHQVSKTKPRKTKKTKKSLKSVKKRKRSTTDDTDNSENNGQDQYYQSSFAEVDLPVAEDDVDSDKLFLMAFLPEMKQLPPNLKMWARTQIATIMQEAVTSAYTGQPLDVDRKIQPNI